MAPYGIDYEFYKSNFKGESVSETDFPILVKRAAEIVEEMTMYRINEDIIGNSSEDIQKRVREAICAQLEYLDANGGFDLDSGNQIQSGTIGKFSFTAGASADGELGASIYSNRARRILYPTGLLYRGVI